MSRISPKYISFIDPANHTGAPLARMLRAPIVRVSSPCPLCDILHRNPHHVAVMDSQIRDHRTVFSSLGLSPFKEQTECCAVANNIFVLMACGHPARFQYALDNLDRLGAAHNHLYDLPFQAGKMGDSEMGRMLVSTGKCRMENYLKGLIFTDHADVFEKEIYAAPFPHDLGAKYCMYALWGNATNVIRFLCNTYPTSVMDTLNSLFKYDATGLSHISDMRSINTIFASVADFRLGPDGPRTTAIVYARIIAHASDDVFAFICDDPRCNSSIKNVSRRMQDMIYAYLRGMFPEKPRARRHALSRLLDLYPALTCSL